MKRVAVALLVASNLAHGGVILVDEAKPAVKKPAPVVETTIAPVSTWKKVNQWEIKAGNSLRIVLDAWCERAGYRLIWNVESGFQSQGNFVSESDFQEAIKELFAAIPQDLHLNVDVTKNKLVIVSGGGQ